jgi:hypothetical protein
MALRSSIPRWIGLLVLLGAVHLGLPAVARRPEPIVRTATFSYIDSPRARRVRMSEVDKDGPQPVQPPLNQVPQSRQHSLSACGLGLAQMYCGYYMPEVPRGGALVKKALRAVRERGYTYDDGTPTPVLREVLTELGFKVRVKTNMSLAELVRQVSRGYPVGVGAQAWTSKKKVDWDKDTDDGHYMMVIGFGDWNGKPYSSARAIRRAMKKDPNNAIVWLADPAMSTGRRGWMPVSEFLDRWHWPGERHLGILVRPQHDTGARARAFIFETQRVR